MKPPYVKIVWDVLVDPEDLLLWEQIQANDPYAFEFLGLSAEVAERDLEQALMDRIVETQRELGPGFAFVGRQVHFDVDGDNFYLDLLFFHVEQLRYLSASQVAPVCRSS